MAFKVPEQYRVTEEQARSFRFISKALAEYVSRLVLSEDAIGNNGYFLLPEKSKPKGRCYIVKAGELEDWCFIAARHVSERQPLSHDDMFYLASLFWDSPDDVIASFSSISKPYPGAVGWLYLWSCKRKWQVPPIFDHVHFKKQPFLKKLIHHIKKAR